MNRERFDDDPERVPTVPSGATVQADRRDAVAAAAPDRLPTPEEDAAAPEGPADPEVAGTYREALERGARHPGEGRV